MVQPTTPTASALEIIKWKCGTPVMVPPCTSTISQLMLQPFLAQMGLAGMNTVSNQFNGQTQMPPYSPVLHSAQPEYQPIRQVLYSSRWWSIFFYDCANKTPDLSSQVSPDLDEQFMSINDALHHLKNNFLWVVDYFANVSIPTWVSELDQTIAQALKASALNVLKQNN